MKKNIISILSAAILGATLLPSGVSFAATSVGTATVKSGVNFRADQSTNAPIYGFIKAGTVVPLEAANDYWLLVNYNGKQGYISRSYATLNIYPSPAPTPTPAPTTGNSIEAKREKIVQTALGLQSQVQYVNWRQRQEVRAPYLTDCSGFTYLAYRLANIGTTLVNKDDDAQAKVGQQVAWGNFVKGDLIFTWNSGSVNKSDVGHVGIYIGDGKMIHNSGSKNDVVISNIYQGSYYKDRFIVARRVIN